MAQSHSRRIEYDAENRAEINAYSREWRRRHRDRLNQQAKESRPQKREKLLTQDAARRKRNAEGGWCADHGGRRPLAFRKQCVICLNHTLRIAVKRHGHPETATTEVEYQGFLVSQGGSCICGTAFSDDNAPTVDHCHSTGKVRGLLCELCNKGIGLAKDSATVLDRLAAYLRRSYT